MLGQAAAPHASTVSPAPARAPAQWLRAVLAATARAGSARFTYWHVTESPNPVLRSSIAGSGAVDFTTGAVQVAEVERQGVTSPAGLVPPHTTPPALNTVAPARQAVAPLNNVVETIAIGKAVYQDLGGRWMKLPLPRDPHVALGLELAANASVALYGLEGIEPVVSVRRLGSARVDGVATTRYLVRDAPPRPCGHTRIPAPAETQGATTVWVDHAERLVRAQVTVSSSGYLPPAARAFRGFASLPRGATSTTATLTFAHFGGPVTIVAPPLTPLQGGSSVGFAISTYSCTGKAKG